MPFGIFLFSLKSEFQKSEENGEKRRKPEKISGFLLGIFFVKTHWLVLTKKMPYSFLLFFLTLHRIMICIITAVSIKGILQASNIGGNSINNPKNFMRKKKNQQIDAIK